MDFLSTLFTAVFGVAVGGTIVIYIFKTWLTERLKQSIAHEYNFESHKSKEIWLLKRDACLKALKLANALLSNYRYEHIPDSNIIKQYMSTEEARSCIDELSCTCDQSDVLDQLNNIISPANGVISADAIVDLRIAIRKELGFSKNNIDLDKKFALLGKVGCHPPK